MKRFITLFAAVLLVSACSETTPDHRADMQLAAPGMHCEGCTATVEETLMKMDGVDSVYADLDSKNVFVHADTTRSSRAALEQMIDRLGFARAPGEE
ncbi:MAG: hypothetical protein C0600_08150 [Ignavibacteria bacterium]|nr:MAG: hypothetical protein C0600_08150 [Ignavibacteria bacterium]